MSEASKKLRWLKTMMETPQRLQIERRSQAATIGQLQSDSLIPLGEVFEELAARDSRDCTKSVPKSRGGKRMDSLDDRSANDRTDWPLGIKPYRRSDGDIHHTATELYALTAFQNIL